MTTKLSDGERLVRLETKMDAVIQSQENTTKTLTTFTDKIDQLLPTYATKSEVDTKIENLRKAHTLQVWLVGTLSAAFGIIMTVLITGYFSK